MRVTLIDTSTPGRPGSMQRYADLVRRALQGLPEERRPEVAVVSLAPRAATTQRLPGPIGNWLHHALCAWRLRARVRSTQPEVVHILDGSHAYLATLVPSGLPVVATAHDLIPLLTERGELPGRRPSFAGRWLGRLALRGLRGCRRVLADSQATVRDLQRLADLPGEQLLTVYLPIDGTLGSDRAFAPTARVSAPAGAGERRAATAPMVLHLGHNGAYKNREGVLRIVAIVARECPVRLVMAGPAPSEGLRDLAVSLGLEGIVEWRTDVADADLQELYRQAAVLLFPSLYEGFGWPPLEAMTAGCPVVCSDAASLPEVVGKAALTAPAADHEQLARHCLAVLRDGTLRDRLVRDGYENLQRFTMEGLAAGLMEAYRLAVLGGETTERE